MHDSLVVDGSRGWFASLWGIRSLARIPTLPELTEAMKSGVHHEISTLPEPKRDRRSLRIQVARHVCTQRM